MEIVSLRPGDALWEAVAACAEDCSWRAGKGLAQQMREDGSRTGSGCSLW